MKDQAITKLHELKGMLEAQLEIHQSAVEMYDSSAKEMKSGYGQGYYDGLARAHKEAASKSDRSLAKVIEIIKEVDNA